MKHHVGTSYGPRDLETSVRMTYTSTQCRVSLVIRLGQLPQQGVSETNISEATPPYFSDLDRGGNTKFKSNRCE